MKLTLSSAPLPQQHKTCQPPYHLLSLSLTTPPPQKKGNEQTSSHFFIYSLFPQEKPQEPPRNRFFSIPSTFPVFSPTPPEAWLVTPLASLGPTELTNEVKSLRKSKGLVGAKGAPWAFGGWFVAFGGGLVFGFSGLVGWFVGLGWLVGLLGEQILQRSFAQRILKNLLRKERIWKLESLFSAIAALLVLGRKEETDLKTEKEHNNPTKSTKNSAKTLQPPLKPAQKQQKHTKLPHQNALKPLKYPPWKTSTKLKRPLKTHLFYPTKTKPFGVLFRLRGTAAAMSLEEALQAGPRSTKKFPALPVLQQSNSTERSQKTKMVLGQKENSWGPQVLVHFTRFFGHPFLTHSQMGCFFFVS